MCGHTFGYTEQPALEFPLQPYPAAQKQLCQQLASYTTWNHPEIPQGVSANYPHRRPYTEFFFKLSESHGISGQQPGVSKSRLMPPERAVSPTVCFVTCLATALRFSVCHLANCKPNTSEAASPPPQQTVTLVDGPDPFLKWKSCIDVSDETSLSCNYQSGPPPSTNDPEGTIWNTKLGKVQNYDLGTAHGTD